MGSFRAKERPPAARKGFTRGSIWPTVALGGSWTLGALSAAADSSFLAAAAAVAAAATTAHQAVHGTSLQLLSVAVEVLRSEAR